MSAIGYSWMTMHRGRLSAAIKNTEADFSGPASAAVWRCGPDSRIGAHGFRSGKSDVWGGLGFYENRQAADAAMAEPQGDMPFATHAIESWTGLFAVVAHRGEVNLANADGPHPVITPLKDDPGGVLAVMTSAGYASFSEADQPRMQDFLKKIEDVRAFYSTLDSNVAVQIFDPVGTPDGVSVTIWRDEPEMLQAAYKDGTHRAMLDRHRAVPMFDRSSFTRFRVLASRGLWEGVDPMAKAALT